MGKPNVDNAIDDLVGGGDSNKPSNGNGNKPAKAAPPKAKAAAPKAAPVAKVAKAAGGGDDLIGGAPGATPAKGRKPAQPAPAGKAAAARKPAGPSNTKPAAPSNTKGKAAAPAKAKPAASNGERAGRGGGKFYFDPDDKAAVMKLLKQKVRKATTTAEFATNNDVPTWQVRLAAVALKNDGVFKLVKTGSVLTMQPK